MRRKVQAESIEAIPFTFTYILEDAGWASATFVSQEQTFRFSLSYLGNPLRDLIQVLNEINEWYDDQGTLLVDGSWL